MVKKIVDFTFKFRKINLILILLITVGFGYYAKDLRIATSFDDLMPSNHPYIKIFKEFRENFGGANKISMVLEVKNGDIYTLKTLQTIKDIDDDLHKIPAINHYQVVSIAAGKVKIVESAFGEVKRNQLMPHVPKNEAEIAALRHNIETSDNINGILVTPDGKAAFISAGFYDRTIDYPVVFEAIQKIRAKYQDDSISIYAAGHPMVNGYLQDFLPKIFIFMSLTMLSIIVLLFYYFRNMMGVVLPIASGIISAIIALGIFVMLDYSFEPLIVVIPFLITARAVSHTVQLLARFGEEFIVDNDKIAAAKRSMEGLFAPGILGIFTDAAGIFLIAVAPIPILIKLALTCGLWLMTIILSVVFTVPLMISFWPSPKIAEDNVEGTGIVENVLAKLGVWATGRARWTIGTLVILIGLVSAYFSTGLVIGEGSPGSPIFWPDHEYNVHAKKITNLFGGFDNLIVIVRGEEGQELPIINPQVANAMGRFQHYMQNDPKLGGSSSFVNHVESINAIYHDGDRKWGVINDNRKLLANLFYQWLSGSTPGDFESFVSPKFEYAMISFLYKDHMGETINNAINMAKKFIAENPLEGAKFELAGGLLGVFSASNEIVAKSEMLNLALIFGVVFIFCAATYRSITAGFVLLVPLILAQLLTSAFMAVKGIGLNVATIPVASIGVGLGVDYGIYILSRIKEEFPKCNSYREAIAVGIRTTGRAIFFTGTTLGFAVVFWAFSGLRFQSEMGLLLAMLIFFNMFGAIIVSPTLIAFLRPKFLQRQGIV